MAERVGFEPTAPFGVTGFQDQLLKPLGHLSTLSMKLYFFHPLAANNRYNTLLNILCQHFFQKILKLCYFTVKSCFSALFFFFFIALKRTLPHDRVLWNNSYLNTNAQRIVNTNNTMSTIPIFALLSSLM